MSKKEIRDKFGSEMAKYNSYEKTKEMKEKYATLGKNIYICNDCFSHTIIENGVTIDRCSKCGGSNIQETMMPYIPKTFKEIKAINTLEIDYNDVTKYLQELAGMGEEVKQYKKIFIPRGVIKTQMDMKSTLYIYFEVLEENMTLVETYEFCKEKGFNRFVNYHRFIAIMTGEDEYEQRDMVINPAVMEWGLKNQEMLKDNVDRVIMILVNVNYIYTYLTSKREVEQCESKIDKGVVKKVIDRNGKEKELKHRTIYINDKVKIYTYDDTLATKIRQHKMYKLAFWDVRPHTVNIYDERDKNLPYNERRVIGTRMRKGYVKGKERDKHKYGESGAVYKIKEEENATI